MWRKGGEREEGGVESWRGEEVTEKIVRRKDARHEDSLMCECRCAINCSSCHSCMPHDHVMPLVKL